MLTCKLALLANEVIHALLYSRCEYHAVLQYMPVRYTRLATCSKAQCSKPARARPLFFAPVMSSHRCGSTGTVQQADPLPTSQTQTKRYAAAEKQKLVTKATCLQQQKRLRYEHIDTVDSIVIASVRADVSVRANVSCQRPCPMHLSILCSALLIQCVEQHGAHEEMHCACYRCCVLCQRPENPPNVCLQGFHCRGLVSVRGASADVAFQRLC